MAGRDCGSCAFGLEVVGDIDTSQDIKYVDIILILLYFPEKSEQVWIKMISGS